MRDLALRYKRTVMFGLVGTRQGEDPVSWQTQAKVIKDVNDAGGRMYGQGTTRSINAIFSLKSYLPFDVLPEWQEVRSRPLQEQARLLRDPERRRQLVAAESRMKPKDNKLQGGGAATTDPRKPDYGNLFALKGVDWDDPTVEEIARVRGIHPVEAMIDLSLENPDQVYVQPVVNERPEDVLGMLTHDFTLATFSDSGAHQAQEMGSSLQTHFLHYWVNRRGAFTLEQAVRKMTHDNARAFELKDRGLVREGYNADLVLFEADRVRPQLPKIENDLPGGARRLVQKAEGIRATVVNGVVTLENGASTGEFAGQVLRG
jgi:N-acyl-D-aspartate/D-glutamate deacylase